MDLQKILGVLQSGLPDDVQRNKIIGILADDKEAINDVLDMLAYERALKHKLISDLNLEVGRARVCIESPKAMKKDWTLQNIEALYIKWKGHIRDCFNHEN